MRVLKIEISRYRKLQRQSLSLGEFLLLVGRNGSGKSTFFRAIEFLLMGEQCTDVRAMQQVVGLERLFVADGQPDVSAEILIEPVDVARLNLLLGRTIGDDTPWSGGPVRITRRRSGKKEAPDVLVFEWSEEQRKIFGTHAKKIESDLAGEMAASVLYVRAERFLDAKTGADGDEITADGRSVMSTLFKLAHDHTREISDAFTDFQNHFREVFPEIKNVAVVQRGSTQDLIFDKRHSHWMGTGHQEVAAILGETVDRSPRIVMIEEPERGLHPSAQRDLVSRIRRILGDRQVMISTHSPTLVATVAPESIVQVSVTGTLRRLHANSIGDLVEDLGISFADLLSARVVLMVEGPDDRAAWNAWLETAKLSGLCRVLDTGGYSNVQFYAESQFVRAMQSPPPVCTLLDGDVHSKPDGKTIEARCKQLANDTKGFHKLLPVECLENLLLNPVVWNRHWGVPVAEFERKLGDLKVEWKAKQAAGKKPPPEAKFCFDALVKEFKEVPSRPSHCAEVAAAMKPDEIHDDVRKTIEELRRLCTPA